MTTSSVTQAHVPYYNSPFQLLTCDILLEIFLQCTYRDFRSFSFVSQLCYRVSYQPRCRARRLLKTFSESLRDYLKERLSPASLQSTSEIQKAAYIRLCEELTPCQIFQFASAQRNDPWTYPQYDQIVEKSNHDAFLSGIPCMQVQQESALDLTADQVCQLNELKLKKLYLTRISNEIGFLYKLETLHLNKNKLSSLPSSIKSLQNVTYLDLSFNDFRSIPNCVYSLIKLRNLNLNFNLLTSLHSSLTNLTDLRSLSLEKNPLPNPLPTFFKELTNLQYLYLDTTQELSESPPNSSIQWTNNDRP